MKKSLTRATFLGLVLLSVCNITAQSEYQLLPKKKYPTTSTSPIIKKIILMFEQNDQFTLNFDCANIKPGMVAYVEVYDSLNRRIEEFEPAFTTLEADQMNFELVFDFRLRKKDYSIPTIKSAYVKIFLGRKMSMSNKPVSIGQDYLFSRTWSINESENSVYKSKLILIGKVITQLTAPKLLLQSPKMNKKPTGPGYQADSYLQGSYLNIFSDLISIGNVYEDATDSAGVFYYLPTLYSMHDSKTGNFNLDIQNGQGSNIDKTIFIATPKPVIDPSDKELLTNRIKRKISYFKELRPMPIDKVDADIKSLPSDVKDNSISPPNDIEDPVYIKFSTTNFEEVISQLFHNKGLIGNIYFNINSPKSISSRTASFNLGLVDPVTTYGRILLDKTNWRNTEIKNPTVFYSVKLTKFSILYETDEDLTTYSWSFDNYSLPAKSKLVLDPTSVPTWVDTDPRVKKIWIDYIIPECISCNSKVKEQITAKLIKARKKIELIAQCLDPFSLTKAEMIRIKLKSYQLNATGTGGKDEEEIIFSKNQEFKSIGILSMPEGQPLAYEYLIEVIMPNGKTYSSKWLKSNDPRIIIGSTQIKDQIPNFRD